MGDDLPEKFHLAGIANGSYQAGLFAAKNPDRIDRLLLMSPAHFCPPPTQDCNPYAEESTDIHIFSGLKSMEEKDLKNLFKAEYLA